MWFILVLEFVDRAEHSTLKRLCEAYTQWEENMKQADSLLCLSPGDMGSFLCMCPLHGGWEIIM